MTISVASPTMLDLLRICDQARPDEIAQYVALTGMEWSTDQVASDMFNKSGAKFVFLDDDTPFCVGGWETVIDGVYQSWMVGTMHYWEKYWRSITKLSRQTMEFMFSQGARRLQVCVDTKRTKTCEWYVRGLKLELEGVLYSFGINGEDMAMYVKFRE